ncbi:MAG: hypothetical protein ACP5KN_21145 [Armatimonadota bacterium]
MDARVQLTLVKLQDPRLVKLLLIGLALLVGLSAHLGAVDVDPVFAACPAGGGAGCGSD